MESRKPNLEEQQDETDIPSIPIWLPQTPIKYTFKERVENLTRDFKPTHYEKLDSIFNFPRESNIPNYKALRLVFKALMKQNPKWLIDNKPNATLDNFISFVINHSQEANDLISILKHQTLEKLKLEERRHLIFEENQKREQREKEIYEDKKLILQQMSELLRQKEQIDKKFNQLEKQLFDLINPS